MLLATSPYLGHMTRKAKHSAGDREPRDVQGKKTDEGKEKKNKKIKKRHFSKAEFEGLFSEVAGNKINREL